MKWFTERKKKMEFIRSYVPTSKAQLVQVAMWYCKGDMQKAQEMVDFYTKNMKLPDFDPVQPTFLQQMKNSLADFYGFVKDNQDDLIQGYQLMYNIIKNKGAFPTLQTEGTPLPSINE